MTQIRKMNVGIAVLSVLALLLVKFGDTVRAQDAAQAAPAPAQAQAQTPAQPIAEIPPQAPADTAPAATAAPQGTVIKSESKLVIVDAVVTDKKGAYVHDLKQGDFKVYEDNKEQQVSAFSSGMDAAIQANKSIKRYLVLFFDNSSMAMPDQIQARAAAAKFIDAN